MGADGKHRKVAPEPPPAVDPADLRPRSVELPVGALESEALWERLDAIDREALRAPRNWGLDGISIKATFLELDDSMESFEMWSPARQTAGGELVAALLDLACPRIPESPLAATMVRIGARMR